MNNKMDFQKSQKSCQWFINTVYSKEVFSAWSLSDCRKYPHPTAPHQEKNCNTERERNTCQGGTLWAGWQRLTLKKKKTTQNTILLFENSFSAFISGFVWPLQTTRCLVRPVNGDIWRYWACSVEQASGFFCGRMQKSLKVRCLVIHGGCWNPCAILMY